MNLFDTRIALIRNFLIESRLDAVLLSRVDNFAMATGGKRNHVNIAQDGGVASLLVRRDGAPVLFANEIEMPRMLDEEITGYDCEHREFPWFEGSVAELARREFGGEIASDDGAIGQNVHEQLMPIRAMLTLEEIDKYREIGAVAANAMELTLASITPGTGEHEIAAALTHAGMQAGCLVPVHLIAADERIARYRHPLHTLPPIDGRQSHPVDRYVMVVGGFVRDGLSVSITRFRCVGEMSGDILDAYERICCVDARLQEATRFGRTLGEIFIDCQRAYVEFGFDANEWHKHHQGGTTGYGARTCKAAPGESFRIDSEPWTRRLRERFGIDVPLGYAFAWNPSAPGVKSEDTFVLLPDGSREIISRTPGLPEVDLERRLGRKTEVVKSGMAR